MFSLFPSRDTPLHRLIRSSHQVRAKGKSHKDFGRLFLAQELVIEPGTQRPSIASAGDDESIHSSTLGDAASIHSKTSRGKTEETPAAGPSAQRKKNAVWATKFSEDGKYLAVGGKDGVVRGASGGLCVSSSSSLFLTDLPLSQSGKCCQARKIAPRRSTRLLLSTRPSRTTSLHSVAPHRRSRQPRRLQQRLPCLPLPAVARREARRGVEPPSASCLSLVLDPCGSLSDTKPTSWTSVGARCASSPHCEVSPTLPAPAILTLLRAP